MLRAARIARHCRVYSSITVNSLTPLPSSVRICTKSYAQTWFLHAGRSRTHDPSPSHSRPRLGCLAGTLGPSRRHILSTCLWFTCHPRYLSRAVILR